MFYLHGLCAFDGTRFPSGGCFKCSLSSRMDLWLSAGINGSAQSFPSQVADRFSCHIGFPDQFCFCLNKVRPKMASADPPAKLTFLTISVIRAL
jgi:hypothetical protein